MITPIEIQSKTFKSGGLGYDKKDVDGFIREVLKSYEIIYRENMELNDKISTLSNGIQYYKTIEKTLQKALVLAEKTADETKAAAMDKAKVIEREAQTRAQLIVADAKNELERVHSQTIEIIQQYEKYKAQFKHLAAAQIELIESEAFELHVSKIDTFAKPESFKDTVASDTATVYDEAAIAQEDNDFLTDMAQVSAQMEPFVPDTYEEETKEEFEDDAPDPFDELEQQEEFSFFSLDEDEGKNKR